MIETNNQEELLVEGRALYKIGKYKEAIDLLASHAASQISQKKPLNVGFLFYMGLSSMGIKDYKSAKSAFSAALRMAPGVYIFKKNLAVSNFKLGLLKTALKQLHECEKEKSEDYEVLHAITVTNYMLRDNKRAVKLGGELLALKESKNRLSPHKKWRLSSIKIATFPLQKDKKYIISYSLWGDDAKYTDGAVRNAQIAPVVYPGWQCRFYCDESVPKSVIEQLEQLGTEIVMMPKSEGYRGLFWRFLVANDPSVDRFLIRDADSPLTLQERLAVEEWIDSKELFHIMRDNIYHTELILAGMWGGVSGVLPELKHQIDSYFASSTKDPTVDQRFLREYIWPLIREHHLAHDEVYKFANAKLFPKQAPDLECMHVGINWHGFDECQKKSR